MPAWNTMTTLQYRALTAYVKQGGTLCPGLPQFNTDPGQSPPWRFIRGGDLRDLCGVRLGASEQKERGSPGSWTGSTAVATVVQRSACGLPVGRTFVLHPPRKTVALGRHGARVIAQSQEGRPVLLEHALGRGRVILLTL